jgi:SH3 domain protein
MLLLISNVSFSQTLYITDKIPIPIYSQADKNSPLVKKLPSGTQVTSDKAEGLASENKFIKIETKDGTSGWIEAIYLTNEQPTQKEYLQLAAKYKDAEVKIKDYETRLLELQRLRKDAKTVDWLRNQLNENKKREAAFEQQIKQKDIALAELRISIAGLEEQLPGSISADNNAQNLTPSANQQTFNSSYVEDIGAYANSSSIRFYTWLVLSLAVTLIIGILLGFVLLENKNRKKSSYVKQI